MAALLAATLLFTGCALLKRGEGGGAEPKPPAIDLNTASLREVERLPGITPSMAKRIVDGRPYERLDDLVDRGILTRRELDRLEDRATVGH
jgi:DNA uptake protein ComE-like DNA-binding protein